jgi:outer membrane protein assembly factor BamB
MPPNSNQRAALTRISGCGIPGESMHKRSHLPLSLLLMLIPVGSSMAQKGQADEWMRFRGPNGAGISSLSDLPVEFGPERNLVWVSQVPPGHSSPVLTDTHVFLTAHTPEKEKYRLLVLCLDRASGKLLWQREIPRAMQGRLQNVNGPSSSSPVTDGVNVYVFFQEFGLAAFDAAGKQIWSLPLGPFNMYYGFGASPILADGKLILPVDQDLGSYLLAVDAKTGKVIWKTDRPDVFSGYSTPMLYLPAKGPQQILIPESYQLSAYSALDGKRVWWVRGLACEMKSVPSYDKDYLYINGWGWPQNQPGKQVPTVPFSEGLKRYDKNGDGFISAGEISGDDPMDRVLSPKFGFEAFDLNRDGRLDEREWEGFRLQMASENGLLAIKLGGEGDMTATAVRWRYQRPVPQVPSTLLYQGVLFMVNDGGIFTSFDPATGSVIKQGRLQGAIDKYFASLVGAGGKIWALSQDGTASVVAAKGDWEVLSVNKLDDEVFATPAIAGNRLLIRTRSRLYCFGK